VRADAAAVGVLIAIVAALAEVLPSGDLNFVRQIVDGVKNRVVVGKVFDLAVWESLDRKSVV